MVPQRVLAAGVALALAAVPGRAGKFDVSEPDASAAPVKFSGLLDFRFHAASREVSWLRGGSNRLRYGGRDTNGDRRGDAAAAGASIPQASLVVDAAVHPGAMIHAQANFSTDAGTVTASVEVVEAYGEAAAAFDRDTLSLRAGGFIPRISWEHPDPAWSTRYTLTPSAAGSWVGEEVRVLGAEGAWDRSFGSAQTRLQAGVFSGGDQIGRLLWFRGWSLGDYQGGLTGRYMVQSRAYSPSAELDGRLGYHGRAGLTLLDRLVELGGGYWTNNADDRLGQPGVADLDGQGFRTSLFHYGGKIEGSGCTFIAQYLKATVSAVDKPARDWSSAYGLGSARLGRARLSARYDRFWSKGLDSGHAFTAFASWDFSLRQQLGLEWVYAYSRPSQATRPAAEVNRLATLNYRLRF